MTTKKETMVEKYGKLKRLMRERKIPIWRVAARAGINERTLRYKFSLTGSRLNDREMFAIQRNVFPDKTLEELFSE